MSDGAPKIACPKCRALNRNQARFCTSCGQSFTGGAAIADTSTPTSGGGPVAGGPPHSAASGSAPQPLASVTPTVPIAPQAPASSGPGTMESFGAKLAGAWQKVVGLARDLRPAGESDDDGLALRSASPDDYSAGLKPASGKLSDVGSVRQVNEDSLLAFEFTKVQESRGTPIGFYVVADGMGGHQAGEVASRTVNKIVMDKVYSKEVAPSLALSTRRLDETSESVLASAFKEANRILYERARAQGNDMGTTLTAVLMIGDTATIANVGDSRTYLWRAGALRQVTKDHSLVASLVQAGMLQPSEVRSHPQRNQVYRTLGTKPEVDIDVFTEPLQRGDRLVLCSDGLWEMVTDAEISRTVGQARSPQDACKSLIQQANKAGGQDNITVIVVKTE